MIKFREKLISRNVKPKVYYLLISLTDYQNVTQILLMRLYTKSSLRSSEYIYSASDIRSVTKNGRRQWIQTTDLIRNLWIKQNNACIRISNICMRNINTFHNTTQFTFMSVSVHCLNRIYMSYEQAHEVVCKDAHIRNGFVQSVNNGLRQQVGILTCFHTSSYISTIYCHV
jgi:hypothetical protein